MADETLRPADADETKDRTAQGASTADASGAETPDETPKRRSRRTPVIDLTTNGADDEAPAPTPKRASHKKATEPSDEPPAEKKPRVRKKKAETPEPLTEPATETPSGETAPAETASDETTPDAPAPRRRRRTREAEPVASSDALPDESDDEPSGREDRPKDEARSRSERQRDDRQRDDRQRDDRQRDDDDGGSRRGRKRKRGKNRDGQPSGNQNQGGGHPGEPFEGMLELIGDKKFGFIRGFQTSLQKGDNDPFMPPPLIQKYKLRDGVLLKGLIKPGRKGAWQVTEVHEVMGGDPDAWADVPDFDSGLVIYPEEKLQLVTGPADVSMRVIDLVAPLGKGQRALIVAPPRAGKTVLLKGIAAGISQNHPNIELVALLIDERPEEVTDFRRNTEATVFASSNDFGEDNHVRVATLAFEYSRRLVEQGLDVVILLDSLTRLGRTFNLFGGTSGRTMSGGLDARALLMPRKIFGAARNIEDGGSLTIVATALVETGSRMDDVIFEEFKGTGNSEIVLDRELSEKRIYPAINIRKSGTRNEDRLVAEEHLRQRHMLLRALNSRHPVEAMQALLKQIQLTPSNAHLLNELVPESA